MTTGTHNSWWRCPKCGTEAGHPEMPDYVKFHPPACSWGHEPCEMEQTTPGREERSMSSQERCPTCGSDDSTDNYREGLLPCPDPFHARPETAETEGEK